MIHRFEGQSVPGETLEKVRLLHAEVDSLVANRADSLLRPLACRRGCFDCCIDGLKVFPVEAALITADCLDLLTNEEPHIPGRCAFLDDAGSCRIYPWRPYVCRTQGLPLRWLEEDPEGVLVELRDICPLNDEALQTVGMRLEDLDPDQCWTLGGFESRLAGLQAALTGFVDEPPRVPLRSLFESGF